MKKVDWVKIRTEYETSNTSYRKIAEKYEVSFPTLRDRAKREGWIKSKKETHNKIVTKTLQKTVTKIAERESDRNARHIALLDKILDYTEVIVNEELNKSVTQFGKKITTELIQIDKLESAMKILEKAQKGHRLALGIDKEDKSKDDADRALSMKKARERVRNGRTTKQLDN